MAATTPTISSPKAVPGLQALCPIPSQDMEVCTQLELPLEGERLHIELGFVWTALHQNIAATSTNLLVVAQGTLEFPPDERTVAPILLACASVDSLRSSLPSSCPRRGLPVKALAPSSPKWDRILLGQQSMAMSPELCFHVMNPNSSLSFSGQRASKGEEMRSFPL